MTRVFFVHAVFRLFLPVSALLNAAEVPTLDSRIILSKTPARLVHLTAHMRVKNLSSTPISRYVFRITEPPNLGSQRSVLLSSDVPAAFRKQHKNGANNYLEFHYPVPAKREVVQKATFLALLIPVNYLKVRNLIEQPNSDSEYLTRYLEPTPHIESDSPEVRQVASSIFNQSQSEMLKAKVAYAFPSRVLKFKVQKNRLGAQKALQTRTGDCTEYACLFTALCRSQSIPARRVGVFNFGKNLRITKSAPNHDSAEVYLSSHGWIPVDANLGQGRYNRPNGFGKLSNTILVLNREGAWVWSTWLPPNGYNKSEPKPKVEYGISWDARVIKENTALNLYNEMLKVNISKR